MEAQQTTNLAADGWECQEVDFAAGRLFLAIPPSPRHYLHGATPTHAGGKFGYAFLRPDVALATVKRDARYREGGQK